MRRLETRELFLQLWRRGYFTSHIAEMEARFGGYTIDGAAVDVEDMLRDAVNEEAKHRRRAKKTVAP